MGGHGGLNILPQKRWNEYNRDNRLKVARDEATHAAQEQELQAKHRAAEAEARRKLLLQRAKERRAEALSSAGLAEQAAALDSLSADADVEENASQDAHAADLQLTVAEGRQDGSHQQQQQHAQLYIEQDEDQHQPVLEHINFWKELEAKAEHPDRQKEKREELRKRGNPDTHTVDARFDESFQFGHGLAGPKPWYARAVDPSAEQQWENLAQQKQHQPQQRTLMLPGAPEPAVNQGKHKHHSRKKESVRSSSSDSSSSNSDSSEEARHKRRKEESRKSRHRSKERKRRKQHKKDKHKKHSKHPGGSSAAAADADKALALARLRAERLEREAAERHRSLVASGQMPAPSKRYNNSYGYADALRAGNSVPVDHTAARGAAAAALTGLGQRFQP